MAAGQTSSTNGAVDPRPTSPDYVGTINAAIDVISARLLCLIAVVGAVGMFGWAVVDPLPWRTYTVAAYAVVVIWPLVWQMARNNA